LADDDVKQLTVQQVDRLVLRFAGSLDSDLALRRMAAWLDEQGLDRAVEVIRLRLEHDSTEVESSRKKE
jgi:hypothetical protein